MNAILVRGDAMSVPDVEKAFGQIEEVEAVVSTIGGTPANPKADSEVRSNPGRACTARKETVPITGSVAIGFLDCKHYDTRNWHMR